MLGVRGRAGEVEEVAGLVSAGTGLRYPVMMVCGIWHVAKKGDRWAALEPIRQSVQQTHGGYAPKIALGLGLRMDWGPQYTAHQFLGEPRWLGIRPTPIRHSQKSEDSQPSSGASNHKRHRSVQQPAQKA